MSTTEQARDDKDHQLVKVAGYLLMALILFAALELASYGVCKYLSRYGVFFNRSIIKQDYHSYLNKRDLQLGWLPRLAHVYGARPDPSNFSQSRPCIDVYGDSFTWGHEVGDSEAWPAVMSESYSSVELETSELAGTEPIRLI